MNVVFNHALLAEEEFNLKVSNRCFQYGDGLFETIIVLNRQVRFLDAHLQRITEGMKVLDMEAPKNFTHNVVEGLIKQITEANALSDSARIKLHAWRKPGGLYTPINNEADFLLTANPFLAAATKSNSVGICESVRLQETIISKYKTCNSLPYILAALEKQKKGLDDLIILDIEGNIAECTASNIFWRIDRTFYTPALSTGCVRGVRRSEVMRKLSSTGFDVKEVKALPKTIKDAEIVFSCNVAGVFPITKIEEMEFPFVDHDLMTELK